MKQIRIRKQDRPTREWLEPLPLELRDPDVVRAKQLARRADRRPSASSGPGRGLDQRERWVQDGCGGC